MKNKKKGWLIVSVIAVVVAIVSLCSVVLFESENKGGAELPEVSGGTPSSERSREVVIEDTTFSSGTLTVQGGTNMTIQNCTFTGITTGAIYVNTNATLNLENCTFVDNTKVTGDGAALYIDGATVNINNCFFENNATSTVDGTSYKGGAIYAQSATLNISNTSLVNGLTTSYGGALAFNTSSTVQILGGVTIDNCEGCRGGAISVENYSSLTITGENNVIKNCSATDTSYGGGAIYNYYGKLIIDDAVITGNSATTAGGGIYHYGPSATSTISNCEISGNTANSGGGVYISYGTLTIDGAEIMGNTASNGGGIYCYGGAVSLESNSKLDTNISSSHGGNVYIAKTAELNVTNSTITGDGKTVQATNGGGVYIYGTLNLDNGSVVTNNLVSKVGAGLYMNTSAVLNVNGTEGNNIEISYNKAGGSGGALGVQTVSAKIYMNYVQINNNEAGSIGGGIYFSKTIESSFSNAVIHDNTAQNGGGIAFQSVTRETHSLFGVQIKDNTATKYGGGIYAYSSRVEVGSIEISGNTASSQGGGIFVEGENSVLTTESATISSNTSYFGGGVSIYNVTSTNTLSNTTLHNNTSTRYGGGIYIRGSNVELNTATITGNNATQYGGGVYVIDSSSVLSMSGSTISSNTAGTDGGGIFLKEVGTDSSTTFELSGATISSNTATRGGGVFCNTAYVTLSSMLISGNSASYGGGMYIIDGYLNLVGNNQQGNNNTLKIFSNIADSVGGGVFFTSSTVDVDGPSLYLNKAGTDGGGIATPYSGNSEFTLNTGYITDNTANSEGGGLYCGYSYVNLNGGTISNNTAHENGGGVYLGFCATRINDGLIKGNVITELGSKDNTMRGAGLVIYYGYNRSTDPNDGTIITGGEISENKIINVNVETDSNTHEYAAGIYISGTMTVNMQGGTVKDNYFVNPHDAKGANIYVNDNSTFLMNGGTISHLQNMSSLYSDYSDATWGNAIYNIGKTIINSGTITSHASNGGAIFNADPFPITDTTYDTGLTINGGSISNTKGVAIYTLMPMSIDGDVSCVGAIAIGTNTPLADDYDGENVYYRTGYLNIAGESHSQIYEIDIFDYEMDSTNLNYSICDDQEMIKIHYLKDYSSDIDGINYTALNLSIVRGENIDRDKLSFYSNSDEMIGFYSANDGYGLCESLLFTLDGVEYYVAYGTEVLFEDGRVTFDGQTIEIDGYDPEFMSLEYRIDNGDLYYFDGVELYNSYIDGFGEYFVSETLYVFEDVVVCVETQTIEYSINVASSYEFLAYGGCEFEVNGIDIMVDGVSVNFNDCFGQGAGNCYAVLQHWNVEGELQDADGNVLELEGEQVEDGVYYVCSDLYITYEAIEKEKIETSYSCYKSGITNFEESGVIEGFEFEVYVEGDDYNAWVTIRYAYDSNGYEFIYDELTINIDFDSTYDELTGNYLAEGYEGEYVTYDDGQEAMEWQGGYYIGSWVESIEISVLVYLRD